VREENWVAQKQATAHWQKGLSCHNRLPGLLRFGLMQLDYSASDVDDLITKPRSGHSDQPYMHRLQPEHWMSERDAFTLRLKPDLLRFVKEAAEDQNRSVPNYVETVLLAEKRRQNAKAARPADGE